MTLINDGGMSPQLREAYRKLAPKPKPKTVPEAITYESAEYIAHSYILDVGKALDKGLPDLITRRGNMSTCVYCKSALPFAIQMRDGQRKSTSVPSALVVLPLTELGPSFAYVHLRSDRENRARQLDSHGQPTGKLGPIRQFWEVRLDWKEGEWSVTDIHQEFSE